MGCPVAIGEANREERRVRRRCPSQATAYAPGMVRCSARSLLSWSAGWVLALLVPAGCSAAPGDPAAGPQVLSFEQDPVGAVPAGFAVAETDGAGRTARWAVADGLDPDDPGHVVRVETGNTGSTFNLLLSEALHPADLELSAYVFAQSGEEDQGGGLVWRARDADNYYVTRWNPLEDNVRLYHVVAGRRTMLASADVEAREKMWHRLRVTARGEDIAVDFDGRECLRHRDATLAGPGRIGFWTKADAGSLFDRLEIAPLR